MNYLKQIVAFHRLARERNLSPAVRSVYHMLLDENNHNGWKPTVEVSNSELAENACVHKNTVKAAKEELRRMGLIEYENVSRSGKTTSYRIIPLEYQKVGHAPPNEVDAKMSSPPNTPVLKCPSQCPSQCPSSVLKCPTVDAKMSYSPLTKGVKSTSVAPLNILNYIKLNKIKKRVIHSLTYSNRARARGEEESTATEEGVSERLQEKNFGRQESQIEAESQTDAAEAEQLRLEKGEGKERLQEGKAQEALRSLEALEAEFGQNVAEEATRRAKYYHKEANYRYVRQICREIAAMQRPKNPTKETRAGGCFEHRKLNYREEYAEKSARRAAYEFLKPEYEGGYMTDETAKWEFDQLRREFDEEYEQYDGKDHITTAEA